MRPIFGKLVWVSFAIFLFAAISIAQDLDDVTISGTVVDSNKAPIAGSNVTATSLSRGTERSVVTDENGRYRIIELPPGVYKISASAAGFGTQTKSDLETISGQNVQIEFTLKPADVKAETTVTIGEDDGPAVDTTRTIVGGTITEKEITELPNNSRNPYDLVLTLGGTSEEALSTRDLAEDRNVTSATAPAEQGNFSLSGGASYSNNITIDGFDNNDDRAANLRFQPSLEAISEVQVVINQFSAEYGRASGGRVNLQVRPGSNKFHGRLFMFFRDDNLNANTWYNNSRSIPRLPLTEYVPGFSLHGPISFPSFGGIPAYDGKNRTFFSITYEHNRLLDTTAIDTFVPVGTNSRFTLPTGNSTCPVANCVDASSSPATPILPYNVLFDTPSMNHSWTARFDHKFNSANEVTLGWQLGRLKNQRTTSATTTRLDNALQARTRDTDAYNFTHNWVASSKMVNQFRAQYSIFEPGFQTETPNDAVVLIGYRNPVTNGNQTLIAGNSTASGGNNETFPQVRTETRYQISDSLTYVFPSHTLKTGFDIQGIRSKSKELSDATGTFNFANVLTYQQNSLSRFRQNFGTGSDVKNTYWSLFAQDELRAFPGFTISYGLRYERETAISDANNFGPRFGIAWDPFKKGKGVIRFGAAMVYNRTLLRTVADSIQNQNGIVPFDTNTIGTGATDPRRVAVLTALAQQFPNGFASEAALHSLVTSACATIVTTFPCNSNTGFILNSGSSGNPLRSVDSTLKIPESYQMNLGFEREILKGIVFEANYTWNKTVRLWRDRNINVPVLPAGFADWTSYLLVNPFVFTNPLATTPTTRNYVFFLGTATDGISTSTSQTSQVNCPTTGTVTCYVNLNSISSSTTPPSIAITGSSTNSVGGPIGIALAAISRFRPDQNFEEKSRIGSIGKSFYNGLVLSLNSRRKQLGAGFASTFRGSYTWSSTKDDGLNNTANSQFNGDFAAEYGRSLQDRRHRIALRGSLELPVWLGKFNLSPIYRWGSSAPFNLGIGGSDRNLDDLGTDRPNFSGDTKDLIWRKPGSPLPTVFSQLSLPTIGSKGGNLARNIGRGPRMHVFDLNIGREIKFTEKVRLSPVLEIGNVFNDAVFNYGAAFIDFSTAGQNAFLIPIRTYRQRQIRLGMRFDF